ncbi:uncharacterized protein DS421_17g580270 [Arachis hypogaea]|nr:uncharacterized protein DS421_17g580270 [Arachis hypogaea]
MAKISYAAIFALILIISVSMASVEGSLCSNDMYITNPPCQESFCKLICAGRYDGGRGHCATRKSNKISYEVCVCIHEHDCPP